MVRNVDRIRHDPVPGAPERLQGGRVSYRDSDTAHYDGLSEQIEAYLEGS